MVTAITLLHRVRINYYETVLSVSLDQKFTVRTTFTIRIINYTISRIILLAIKTYRAQ